MKKIIILSVFIFSISQFAFAQGDFRFGIQASPTFSWMTSNDNMINGNGSNLGMKLGVMGERYFAENYAFVFGLGFSFNAGGTLKHDVGGNLWSQSELSREVLRTLPDGSNLKYGIQYIEIPLGLKMKTQEFGYSRFFAEIPVFTFGINTKARGDINGTVEEFETTEEDIRKDIGFMALSWGLGGGIEYNIGENTTLVGGIFYQATFTDVTDNNGQLYRYDDDMDIIEELGDEDSKGTIGSLTIRIGVLF